MLDFFKNLFPQTDQSQLDEAVRSGAMLVDVRSPGEFSSGSVKGAVNIPLDSIQQQLPKFKGKSKVVVFCRSGSRSNIARQMLAQNGIEAINGGAWHRVNQIVNG